jgi:hypothetical protein
MTVERQISFLTSVGYAVHKMRLMALVIERSAGRPIVINED